MKLIDQYCNSIISILIGVIIMLMVFCCVVCAEELVNIDIIIRLESSGNPNAYNKKSGAIGLMQITPICLEEFKKYHKGKIIARASLDKWSAYEIRDKYDLYIPQVNVMIGTWYLNKRIPQMLRYFKKPITLYTVLVCWNAGINYIVKDLPIPTETVNFIKKYKAIQRGLKGEK